MANASSMVGRMVTRRPIFLASASGLIGISSYAQYVESENERKHSETISLVASQRQSQFSHSLHQQNKHHDIAKGSDDELVIFLPRNYDKDAIEQYWLQRPVSVAFRVGEIAKEMLPLFWVLLRDGKLSNRMFAENEGENDFLSGESLQKHHASKLRLALTKLGPAFVKAGQQLSIRPDLMPPVFLSELQKLCDAVEPIDDEVAFSIIREELRRIYDDNEDLTENTTSVKDPLDVFEGIHLVASASLGQVYKAKLKTSGDEVAIKVQRPDMVRRVSLDLFLLQNVAKAMDGFGTMFTEQAPFHEGLVESFARGSYMELDYENEAINQNHFREEFEKRKSKVHIPSVYSQYTTQRMITTGWVNGIKLSDASQEVIQRLIPVGVELFLSQLLDIGAFHADPHPGNLYVTDDETLCLLDFGLCAEVDTHSRKELTAAIVHLLIGDFDTLISRDAKTLGFLPHDLDTKELQPILKKILTEGLLESGSDLHSRKRKLMEISNELNQVFFNYPFSVPPFFALVTRGLGLLEGIALSGDPDFDIFKASYPYARKKALETFGSHGLNHMRRNMTYRRKIETSL